MARKISSPEDRVSSQVKGGTITREAESGRLVEVMTAKSRIRASKQSASSVAATSSKRSAALKRLVNR
ncbi:hypothetical protein GVY41_15615 [Frigidibacter albus]|uniref:Uncharacterized protein n=1 Tax=Frigidibacter albus TaxID=1465486 RepID=A0A6L8VLN7_9RHOB|nr:hypothetical protein [Frigidibacter albus]MZQ90452.1 hypothetical protein [Frigidibacter albus]NBE32428.1 hypothetical protein [Frigidibacter albus]